MVSLKQTYEQGSLRLAFFCSKPVNCEPGICNHVGRVSIEAALKRWGGEIDIRKIPARCSRCGSREFVSVSGEPPGRIGKRGRR